MKKRNISHISAIFKLSKKPVWLDAFRLKYDQPYDYHISIKTNTYYDIKDISNIKNDLKQVTSNQKPIKVKFKQLFIDKTSSGWCIMIKAEPNKELHRFQKIIIDRFKKYGKHPKKEYERFENDFTPHITIGRHLSFKKLQKAKKELNDDLSCEATINKILLATVTKATFKQWIDPKNRKIYRLK